MRDGVMIENVLKIVLLILIGYMLVLLGLKEKISPKLSKIVFTFFLPIIIFNSLAKSKFSTEYVSVMLIVVMYISLSLPLVIYVAKHMAKDDMGLVSSTVLSATFQNSAFLPIPLAYSLYGNIVPVVIYAYTIILMHYTVADILSSMKEKHEKNIMVLSLKKISRNIIIYAGILGIIFSYFNLNKIFPQELWSVLSVLSTIGIYLSVIIVGLGLPIIKNLNMLVKTPIIFIILWRHAVSPLMHFILGSILVKDELIFKQLMLEAIMPPATANTVLAYVYGFNVETVSKSIILSTALALIEVYAFMFFGLI